MNRTLILTISSAALATLLAACASAPEPLPAPQPTVVNPALPVLEQPDRVQPSDRVAPPIVSAPDPNLPLPGSIDDFVYQSGGDARVYFAYDQHTLSAQARETLRRQAQWLQFYPDYTAIVEGHADERGTRQYNIALGAQRADSVKAFLVSQGIAPSRLTTVSYGKERPIDARSTNEGWVRNRNGYTNLRPLGSS